MKRSRQHCRRLVILAVVSFSSVAIQASAAEFTSLFNGTSLRGWTGATEGYTAKDGVLTCLGTGRHNIYTERQYQDFILKFDFKLSPGANNGLAIRAPLQGQASTVGMEIQIIDDTDVRYKTIQPFQAHGSIYGIAAAKRGHLRPVGEWNSQVVTCIGRRLAVELNGVSILICDLDTVSPGGRAVDGKPHPGLSNQQGHIGFLGHTSRVEFRNIRIKDLRPLSPSATSTSNATEKLVPFFRILTTTGVHIFTTGTAEVEKHMRLGNKLESIIGYIPASRQTSETVPVVRYLHPRHKKYWYYFTLRRPSGFPASAHHGQLGWAYRKDGPGRVRVFHVRNVRTQEELFTDNLSEYQSLVRTDWKNLPTLIYAVRNSSPMVSEQNTTLMTKMRSMQAGVVASSRPSGTAALARPMPVDTRSDVHKAPQGGGSVAVGLKNRTVVFQHLDNRNPGDVVELQVEFVCNDKTKLLSPIGIGIGITSRRPPLEGVKAVRFATLTGVELKPLPSLRVDKLSPLQRTNDGKLHQKLYASTSDPYQLANFFGVVTIGRYKVRIPGSIAYGNSKGTVEGDALNALIGAYQQKQLEYGIK
jgi:hypothetical protein